MSGSPLSPALPTLPGSRSPWISGGSQRTSSSLQRADHEGWVEQTPCNGWGQLAPTKLRSYVSLTTGDLWQSEVLVCWERRRLAGRAGRASGAVSLHQPICSFLLRARAMRMEQGQRHNSLHSRRRTQQPNSTYREMTVSRRRALPCPTGQPGSTACE